MNLHNLRQKNLFESYMPPSPVISRCYSSKANMSSFTTTHLPGNSLFSMNKYLGNVGNFNKKQHGVGPPGLRMPLVKGSSYETGIDPIVKIVGGFVGSKSQAGSSNHRGRDLSLWDVILDKIIESMEHPEQHQKPQVARKWGDGGRRVPKIESFTMIGVRSFSATNNGNCLGCVQQKWTTSVPQDCGESVCRATYPELGGENGRCHNKGRSRTAGDTVDSQVPELNDNSSKDCNLAGQTDCSLNSSDRMEHSPTPVSDSIAFEILTPPPSVEPCETSHQIPGKSLSPEVNLNESKENYRPSIRSSTITQISPRLLSESEDDSLPSDVLSSSVDSCSVNIDTFMPRRKVQRSISECSVDSDDSFIVFESTEDEPVILSDDSDDDDSSSDEDLDEIDSFILTPHNCDFSAPQQTLSRLEEANRKWNKTYGHVPTKSKKNCASKKNVKFAEGKNLTQVKQLVAWDFAHRAARVGPWEMYHRDSERFKLRISSLSSVISPILAQKHRKKIYSERFQT